MELTMNTTTLPTRLPSKILLPISRLPFQISERGTNFDPTATYAIVTLMSTGKRQARQGAGSGKAGRTRPGAATQERRERGGRGGGAGAPRRAVGRPTLARAARRR